MFDNLLRESHLPEQSNQRSSSSGGEERQDPARPPPSHEPQTLQHENYGTTVGISIFSLYRPPNAILRYNILFPLTRRYNAHNSRVLPDSNPTRLRLREPKTKETRERDRETRCKLSQV